jgi:hypothetical protein
MNTVTFLFHSVLLWSPVAFQFLLLWGPVTLLLVALPPAVYFYCSLKVELRLQSRRIVARPELDNRRKEMTAALEALRARLTLVESRLAPSDWAPQAVNLNRRGQILRLHGKGRTTAEIASDLQISQGEVELLVKVHDWPSPANL